MFMQSWIISGVYGLAGMVYQPSSGGVSTGGGGGGGAIEVFTKAFQVPEAVEEYLKSFEYPPKPKVIFVDVDEKAEEKIESLL